MPTTKPFETLTSQYDRWYDEAAGAYRSELAALARVLPGAVRESDRTLEVGVGTGRFAGPLGLRYGLDPARAPLEMARDRGVTPIRGVAESLPVRSDSMDALAYVTVCCFLEDLDAAFAEARRALRADGTLLMGLLDRETPVGSAYEEHADEDPFYREATFRSAEELCAALESTEFTVEERAQTIFGDPAEIELDDDDDLPVPDADVREGHGEGLFAVVRASPST